MAGVALENPSLAGKESLRPMTGPLLCIDTSTSIGSVALLDKEGPLASRTKKNQASQAERLFSTIRELMAECGVSFAQLGGVAVAVGPGSFTGLRIGASTVKTLAWVTGKPLYAVGSLMALASGAAEYGLPVCATFNAGRDELYAACYLWRPGSSQAQELLNPCILSVGKLCSLLPGLAHRGKFICLGQGFRKRESEIRACAGKYLQPVPKELDHPNASLLGKLVLASAGQYRVEDILAFEPHYIRVGQAELRLGL